MSIVNIQTFFIRFSTGIAQEWRLSFTTNNNNKVCFPSLRGWWKLYDDLNNFQYHGPHTQWHFQDTSMNISSRNLSLKTIYHVKSTSILLREPDSPVLGPVKALIYPAPRLRSPLEPVPHYNHNSAWLTSWSLRTATLPNHLAGLAQWGLLLRLAPRNVLSDYCAQRHTRGNKRIRSLNSWHTIAWNNLLYFSTQDRPFSLSIKVEQY